MYIRWKKRKQKDGENRLDAVLVESYREGNKVKQRFIKLLAIVNPDSSFEKPINYELAKDQFLHRVRHRLDELNLDSAKREKINEMAVKKFQNTIKM